MLLVISILVVLSLALAIVLAIYFVKTYGMKMTAMWGGLIILHNVLGVLVVLCIIFSFDGVRRKLEEERKEASGQLVQSISEIGRIFEDHTEKLHTRVLAHEQQIRVFQEWIDYFENELEEVKQELGFEYESEPQS
jgi:Na+/melibiose symporter-like transporter